MQGALSCFSDTFDITSLISSNVPGGTGTLEEISEVMSKVSLKQLNAPCILYNLNGYYDSLKNLLNNMIKMGLSTKERQEGIFFANNLDEIRKVLNLK